MDRFAFLETELSLRDLNRALIGLGDFAHTCGFVSFLTSSLHPGVKKNYTLKAFLYWF